MKKIIAFLAALLIFFSASVSYAETFKVRGGISFGMTFEQVKAIEKAKIERQGKNEDKTWIDYYPVKVSGIKNCLVEYIFDKKTKGLKEIYMEIDRKKAEKNSKTVSKEYDKLNKKLIKMYGKPLGNKDGKTSAYVTENLDATCSGIELCKRYYFFDFKYDEWLIKSKGGFVKIDHFYKSRQVRSDWEKVTSHCLIYQFFTPDEKKDGTTK